LDRLLRVPARSSQSLAARRSHVGRCRVIYEIFEQTFTVVVLHLGRVG
jgi:mRNA-degrading endonuclease RelE of RelBE toxin-antitoxin system